MFCIIMRFTGSWTGIQPKQPVTLCMYIHCGFYGAGAQAFGNKSGINSYPHQILSQNQRAGPGFAALLFNIHLIAFRIKVG